MPETTNSANSAALSVKKKRGNPDRIKAHQFKPGQSGNPGGRPRKAKTIFSDAMRDVLAEMEDERSKAEILASKLYVEAITGPTPVQAIREIVDRTEGKPQQALKIDGNINQPSDDRLAEIIAAAATRAAANPAASDS